jgi:hypothetical protein
VELSALQEQEKSMTARLVTIAQQEVPMKSHALSVHTTMAPIQTLIQLASIAMQTTTAQPRV